MTEMKIKILLVLILLIVSISGCLDRPTFGAVPVLHVKVEIGRTTDMPIIENVKVEQGRIAALQQVGRDLPASFPGVHVYIFKGALPLNYWTSMPYEGPGTYELTAEFKSVPAPGDGLRIFVKVVDNAGETIAHNYLNQTMMIWK